MVDVIQLVLGALVLWAPGLAWTWLLAPDLDWAKFTAVSVVVALTVQPAVMYVGNVFLSVPISPTNTVLLSLGLAALPVGLALRPRLDEAWG